MKKGLAIKANREVLKALRESSGYSVEDIAKKLKASQEKLKATEEGTASFTLKESGAGLHIAQREGMGSDVK